MSKQRLVLAVVLVPAILAAACGEEAESASTPTALAELPPPEAFGAIPAPKGARILQETTELMEPSSEPPPSDYSVMGPDYDAVHDPILAAGREIAGMLVSGNAAGVRGRFHSRLQGAMSVEGLLSRINALVTNRVHFDVTALGAMFDGHVDGETISGGYIDDTVTASFSLEAAELAGTGPLEGRWEGVIVLGPDATVAIEIVFESGGGGLVGSLVFSEQGQDGIPLSGVSYDTSRPVGEVMVDLAVQGLYGADHRWGDYVLSIWLTFDSSGNVIGLDTAPRRPLGDHPAAGYQSPTRWRLPVDGIWWVNYGGPTYLQNFHARIPAKRYAYDLAVWKDGGFASGSGSKNEDYYSFGQPVVAPADGTVVTVLDGIEDNRLRQPNALVHPAGNHLVIQTEAQEYVVLAYLQQGSIRVQMGDEVKEGDLLGLVGNSGGSQVPHLHFYVQDQPDILSPIALGLPTTFFNYYADGRLVASGVPVQSELVQQAE